MSQLRPARQILYAGGGIAAVLLLAGLFLRTLPPSRQEMEESAVTVRQASCYVLEADGKAAAYFADYADSVFTGGSVSRDSVHTRCVVQRGYWVNRLPVVPSCFGRIVTGWSNRPAAVVNLGNDAVRRLLFRTLVRMDAEMGGLQTQRNELGYYLRVHSVQDYGYNKIADYHEVVVQRMDSLRKVLEAVHGIVTSHARLRIRQLNSYSITAPGRRKRTVCNRLEILRERNAVLLQTENGMTPFRVTTSLRAGKAADELKRYYRQHPPRPSLSESAGIRVDGGRYDGETRKGRPDGYGRFYGDDGRFYDGHWKEGLRDGFGIYVAPHEYLQVGEWKKGVFKGERLTYNADRIYGIDLSRHQHEQQGRYYHINWNRLRITHLGTLSSKTVKGRVDYPVSFAYVKSTEGCTVLNAYYLTDYAEARRHGIRTGTYHFFSTTSPSAAQADHFLKCSRFGKGDLPPVLDVEPSDAQIAGMGGAEAMFRSIRAWLTRVRQRTGRRPILYVSQMFANRYLPQAPDLGDNYLVWIARYGEYKPNIKLIYWQLSPDGRVRGIHGDVDINVFNGYRNQYGDFLKRHCF